MLKRRSVNLLKIRKSCLSQFLFVRSNILFAAIKVYVDNDCGTCVAGGVQILGLHVTTAPRRHDYHHPVLESFKFVPYTSDDAVSQDKELVEYSELCADCSLKGLQDLLNQHGSNGLKNKTHIETLVSAALTDQKSRIPKPPADIEHVETDKHHSCLGVLKEIFETEYNEQFTENIDHIVQGKGEELRSDCLLGNVHKAEIMKPCLDIVVENVLSKKLKVLEVGNTGMLDTTHHLLDSNPLLNISYTIATTDSDSSDVIKENEAIDDVIKWKPCDKIPANLKKVHLVIANNIIRKQVNLRESLSSIADCVEEGGFLLVQEVTLNFHLAMPLDGLCYEWTCEDLNDRVCGIYCDASKWRKIFSNEGFEIIYEFSDNILTTLFLLRRKMQCSPEMQTLLDVTDCSCDWVDDLKSKMTECQSKPKGENLWLRANDNISGIMGMVNCLRQEPGGDRLRYVMYYKCAPPTQ